MELLTVKGVAATTRMLAWVIGQARGVLRRWRDSTMGWTGRWLRVRMGFEVFLIIGPHRPPPRRRRRKRRGRGGGS